MEHHRRAQLAGMPDDFKNAIQVEGENKWVLDQSTALSTQDLHDHRARNRDLAASRCSTATPARIDPASMTMADFLIRIAQLRAKRAELMGYTPMRPTRLETRMAKDTSAVPRILARVLKPALRRAKEERADSRR